MSVDNLSSSQIVKTSLQKSRIPNRVLNAREWQIMRVKDGLTSLEGFQNVLPFRIANCLREIAAPLAVAATRYSFVPAVLARTRESPKGPVSPGRWDPSVAWTLGPESRLDVRTRESPGRSDP